MKQHIKPTQLEEIPKEQIEKIFKNSSASYYSRKNYYQFHCKKMTIGKMIEVLEDKNMHPVITYANKYHNYNRIVSLSSDRVNLYKSFSDKELCDALWEAIKYVLKSEE